MACKVEVSGNIIKNVKAVTVPNTGGHKGIEAATAAGVVAGKADLMLEVLSQVTEEEITAMAEFLRTTEIAVVPALGDRVFYIRVTVEGGGHSASCEIMDYHTNITCICRDGQVVFQAEAASGAEKQQTDRSVLSVEEIIRFADCVDINDVAEVIRRQIAYNSAISAEGLKGGWGAEVGKTIRAVYGDSVSHPGQGGGRRRLRCPYERLRTAGGHCLRQRQPGHDRLPPRDRICPGHGGGRGGHDPGAGGVRPGDHPPEDRHRPSERVLRRGERRLRRRRRHCLPQGRPL